MAISLDELERLIRLLGMLGSSADGEALNAARLAVRWVAEKHTDWRTLLTPEPEAGVTSVSVAPDPEALEAGRLRDRAQAFDLGYQEGLKPGLTQAMAQVKAQAQMASTWSARFTQAAQAAAAGHAGAAQNPAGGFSAARGGSAGQTAQRPVRAPSAPPGASWQQPGASNPYPAGSWQDVAWALLNRHAAGIPGVLRSREEQFVADVLARGFPTLTAAQEHWLRDIAGRSGLNW